jgi:hypothetical protein
VHDIKEESKEIIAELLGYGVPPDYLLSIGVSRDILEIRFVPSLLPVPSLKHDADSAFIRPRHSFHELNLDLTLPPPSTSSPPLAPLHTNLLHASPTASPTLSPVQIGAVSTTSSSEDLAALEARTRAELLARKAALSARNQQGAQSLESELESLFASVASAAPSSVSPAPPDVGEPDRKRPKLRTAASALHELREAVDHTEETADVPDAGPFSAPGDGSRAGSVVLSSLRMNGAAAPPSRRPVATDFEAEPIAKLSARTLGAHRGAAFLPRAETSMIIDISDDEEEDCETEVGDGDSEMVDSAVGGPSRSHSTAELPSTNANASTAEDLRKRQLEDKDRELQRLKERIAAMEKKRQEPKSRKSSVEPSVNDDVTTVKGKGKEREREKAVEEEEEAVEATVDAIRAIVETAASSAPSGPSCEIPPCSLPLADNPTPS